MYWLSLVFRCVFYFFCCIHIEWHELHDSPRRPKLSWCAIYDHGNSFYDRFVATWCFKYALMYNLIFILFLLLLKGYGDIHPVTVAGKTVICFYALFAVGIISTMVGEISSILRGISSLEHVKVCDQLSNDIPHCECQTQCTFVHWIQIFSILKHRDTLSMMQNVDLIHN